MGALTMSWTVPSSFQSPDGRYLGQEDVLEYLRPLRSITAGQEAPAAVGGRWYRVAALLLLGMTQTVSWPVQDSSLHLGNMAFLRLSSSRMKDTQYAMQTILKGARLLHRDEQQRHRFLARFLGTDSHGDM